MAIIDSNPVEPQNIPPAEEATDMGSPAPESRSELPSPQDLPGADVLIYDGRCVFCDKQVKSLMRLDGKNRLAFISMHDEFVAEQFPDLSYDQMMQQMFLIPSAGDKGGYSSQRLGGVIAIRYLSRRLPKLWILAPLMHFPFSLPLWQWGYAQVAKHRYKIAGKSGPPCDDDGTCDLHFKD